MTNQTLHLQLTPMQIPEALSMSNVATGGDLQQSGLSQHQQIKSSGCEVLVYPREPSEIVLQLENLGNRHLQLEVRLEGSFPLEWCHIRMEGNILAGRSRMDAVIYLQVPADFFENTPLSLPTQTLRLDYQSLICVYYTEEEVNRRLVETAALQIHIRPRSLYLNFLPVLYREVDFIGRFLKIFEQAFEPAVQTMDMLWAYLDPMTAPKTLLPFLAHWVASPVNHHWTLDRQRFLIRHAVEIYRWRGTRRGLRFYIHLYTNLPLDEHISKETDKHICIEEIQGQGFLLGHASLGETTMVGGGRPYHFIVRLRSQPPNLLDEQLIRQIIVQEKPAFCTYELYITNPTPYTLHPTP
jgi:phage tail-like protein